MRTRRALITLLACGIAAVGAAPSLAHSGLVSSGPPKGAVVKKMPRTIVLNFAEALQSAGRGVVLRGGRNHARRTRLNPRNARQVRITTKWNRVGIYTVKVTVRSADGHRLRVSYRFRVRR